MIAVDIGNTFTRLVAFCGETIRGRRSFHTRELAVDEVMGAFAELAAVADVDEVYVASVAPAANAVVDSAAERRGLAARFIRPGHDEIIRHTLTTPETTGVDRLLSALAAGARLFPGEEGKDGYVVAQCGTATTIDLVDGKGVFRGGYIIPGPTLWLRALGQAEQLPDLSGEPADWRAVGPGRNTRDALLHGMQLSLPVAVASSALLVGAELDGGQGRLPVAVTGGWGEAVVRYMRGRHAYDKDLLLHGIRIFAERFGMGE